MTPQRACSPGRNSADNKERAVDEAKTHAAFGIPGPAPCPSWCSGSRVRQIGRLLKETHDTRQAGPDDAR
jgi:hypothetical protein